VTINTPNPKLQYAKPSIPIASKLSSEAMGMLGFAYCNLGFGVLIVTHLLWSSLCTVQETDLNDSALTTPWVSEERNALQRQK
jgi:hypothetical protein